MKIKFKLLKKGAILPAYAYQGDAAFDIYSFENKVLKSGQHGVVKTEIASEIPEGYFVSIRDRSGLAAKHGVHTLAGVIDAGYRGEWGIVLINLGKENFKIKKGERIAQGILHKLPKAEIVEVKNLDETERGDGGFGSTGR